MDFGDDELMDIEEARLILSLKNDEINNLKSSVKANEIRTSLKMADFQYKVQHSQNKAAVAETKLLKAEETLKKAKEKFEQELAQLHTENEKLKQAIEQIQSASRLKERELQGTIYEQKMKLEKEREQNQKWSCEFEIISKYFDPQKILSLLGKEKLEDVPSYVQLYKKYSDAQDIIKDSNLQLSTMRSQIMSQMEESLQKLSSCESAMWDLRLRNEQLRAQVEEKEKQLLLRSEEINQRKSLMEAVEQEATSQIQHLSTELITLRDEYDHYHREEDQVRGRSRSDSFYMEKIQDIEQKYWTKQSHYSQQIGEYEDKLSKLEQENRLLRIELQEVQLKLAESEELQLASSKNYERELQGESKIIALMEASLKDQEEYNHELKRENQKLLKELNEIVIQKRKILQQSKILEEEHRKQVFSLTQELKRQELKLQEPKQLQPQPSINNSEKNSHSSNQHHQLKDFSESANSEKQPKALKRVLSGEGSVYNQQKSKNLLFDLNDKFQLELYGEEVQSNADIGHYEEDPTWPQKYYTLLQKHNAFIKQVCSRLKGLKGQPI